MQYRSLWSVGVVLLLAATWIGCGGGDDLGRKAISGKVTLDGKPLDEGSILFEPQDGSALGGATIKNGEYELEVKGGLPPGTYTVRISAASNDAAPANADQPPGEGASTEEGSLDKPELIPAEWNTESKHTITVGDGDGETTFDFAITTKE